MKIEEATLGGFHAHDRNHIRSFILIDYRGAR
jgi:hypothetical protein